MRVDQHVIKVSVVGKSFSPAGKPNPLAPSRASPKRARTPSRALPQPLSTGSDARQSRKPSSRCATNPPELDALWVSELGTQLGYPRSHGVLSCVPGWRLAKPSIRISFATPLEASARHAQVLTRLRKTLNASRNAEGVPYARRRHLRPLFLRPAEGGVDR